MPERPPSDDREPGAFASQRRGPAVASSDDDRADEAAVLLDADALGALTDAGVIVVDDYDLPWSVVGVEGSRRLGDLDEGRARVRARLAEGQGSPVDGDVIVGVPFASSPEEEGGADEDTAEIPARFYGRELVPVGENAAMLEDWYAAGVEWMEAVGGRIPIHYDEPYDRCREVKVGDTMVYWSQFTPDAPLAHDGMSHLQAGALLGEWCFEFTEENPFSINFPEPLLVAIRDHLKATLRTLESNAIDELDRDEQEELLFRIRLGHLLRSLEDPFLSQAFLGEFREVRVANMRLDLNNCPHEDDEEMIGFGDEVGDEVFQSADAHLVDIQPMLVDEFGIQLVGDHVILDIEGSPGGSFNAAIRFTHQLSATTRQYSEKGGLAESPLMLPEVFPYPDMKEVPGLMEAILTQLGRLCWAVSGQEE